MDYLTNGTFNGEQIPLRFHDGENVGLLDMAENPLSSMLLARSDFFETDAYEYALPLETERLEQLTASAAQTSDTVWPIHDVVHAVEGAIIETANGAIYKIVDVGAADGNGDGPIEVQLLSGAHVAVQQDDLIQVQGPSPKEGYEVESYQSLPDTIDKNYIDQCSRAATLSDLAQTASIYGVSDPRLAARAARIREGNIDIENKWMKGVKAAHSANAGWRLGGIRYWFSTYDTSLSVANFTLANLNPLMYSHVFAQGSSTKFCFFGATAGARLDALFDADKMTFNNESIFGSVYRVWQTRAGNVVLMYHKRMDRMGLSDQLWFVDMQGVRPGYWKGFGKPRILLDVPEGKKAHSNQDEYAAVIALKVNERKQCRISIT